ncbi:hypothetical protein GCM10010441_74370 [Kitasatospora paracochleata]
MLGDHPGDGGAAQVDQAEVDARRQLGRGGLDVDGDHPVDAGLPGDLGGEAGTQVACHAGDEHDLAHESASSSVPP